MEGRVARNYETEISKHLGQIEKRNKIKLNHDLAEFRLKKGLKRLKLTLGRKVCRRSLSQRTGGGGGTRVR